MVAVRTSMGRSARTRPHESTTNPDARLYKKSYGTESKLAYLGYALVANRNGLIAAAMATQPRLMASHDQHYLQQHCA